MILRFTCDVEIRKGENAGIKSGEQDAVFRAIHHLPDKVANEIDVVHIMPFFLTGITELPFLETMQIM